MKNFKAIKDELVIFLRNYLQESGAKGFVLGLSGGLDSAVVAHLCAIAAPERLNVLLLPSKNSSQQHLNDALSVCKALNLTPNIVKIDPVLEGFKSAIDGEISHLRLANLTARTRMCLLYDASASLSSLVVGTSNKSEIMLGYGTIYGDLACALNPIGDLFKTEIRELARELGVSDDIIQKAPSADLWAGQSDEGELGYSYDELDHVLARIEAGASESELIAKFGRDLAISVLARFNANKFKSKMPPVARIGG
ncbi:NAD+ synthase [Campylobacter sp. 19-13652]|uniref:NAD+ synthase n=1 Tax=Campylobacter sp. 19-13652 TaxID=2840180 RepID=UPI001C765741|nr:NAD+ synthase [Campylobacter sp. 19-13652]BCX79296.1 NH(3)-dependent NAD(+) synthetase [Campylobacter sp. 19-13652]